MKNRPKVFISYSRDDQHIRDALAAILGLANIEIMYDIRSLSAGEDFLEEIFQIIDDVDAVLVIWTAASVRSNYVEMEARRAREKEKIVTVSVGDVKPPDEFSRLDCRNFSLSLYDTAHIEDNLNAVIRRMRSLSESDFFSDDKRIRIQFMPPREPSLGDRERESLDEEVAIRPFQHFRQELAALDLIAIPSGKLMIGAKTTEFKSRELEHANKGRYELPEQPRHHAQIARPFLLMRHPFTFGHLKELQSLLQLPSPFNLLANETDETSFFLPITNVSWNEVQALCLELTRNFGVRYRLPTEVEWEYCARGGTDTAYWYGDVCNPDRSIYDGRYVYHAGLKKSTPEVVLPKKRSAKFHSSQPIEVKVRETKNWRPKRRHEHFCISDMLGNVYEWVEDKDGFLYTYYQRRQPRKQAAYDDTTSPYRIIRGGCFSSKPERLRCSARSKAFADSKQSSIGFRLVRECLFPQEN